MSDAQNRILIIEDEKPLRDAFAFLLTAENYEVELAENGRVGLEKLKIFQPDLILLDMLMPVMNGLEFLKKTAKLRAKRPAPKTLLLSNLSDSITVDEAHIYGVTESVLKADLSPVELVTIIKDMLSAAK